MTVAKNQKCTVIEKEVTVSEIHEVLRNQKNTHTINNREGRESALEFALKGSKHYLDAQGFNMEDE